MKIDLFAKLRSSVAIVLTATALMGCASIGEHVVRAPLVPVKQASEPTRWEDVFAKPTAMQVVAYNTGFVFTGPSVLIDEHNPRTPASEKVEQWVPAISYLVTHPVAGRILMDTGVGEADAQGACDFGVWPLFHVHCRASVGAAAASQLAADGVAVSDLRFVLMSHLHGDHAGGLAALSRRGALHIALTPDEWQAANRSNRAFSGYIASQLSASYDVELLPMDRAVTMPILGRCLDLFGDGAIWIVATPGHTRGEISVLLNAEGGPIFLTFDAAHLAANIERRVRPGFAVDDDAATASVDRIADFAKAFPRAKLVYGHEPTQWAGRPRRVDLIGEDSSLLRQ
jgi:glyoxylase-like metal-dependent hydrolase (beta-lactamase superfamily II)